MKLDLSLYLRHLRHAAVIARLDRAILTTKELKIERRGMAGEDR